MRRTFFSLHNWITALARPPHTRSQLSQIVLTSEPEEHSMNPAWLTRQHLQCRRPRRSAKDHRLWPLSAVNVQETQTLIWYHGTVFDIYCMMSSLLPLLQQGIGTYRTRELIQVLLLYFLTFKALIGKYFAGSLKRFFKVLEKKIQFIKCTICKCKIYIYFLKNPHI